MNIFCPSAYRPAYFLYKKHKHKQYFYKWNFLHDCDNEHYSIMLKKTWPLYLNAFQNLSCTVSQIPVAKYKYWSSKCPGNVRWLLNSINLSKLGRITETYWTDQIDDLPKYPYLRQLLFSAEKRCSIFCSWGKTPQTDQKMLLLKDY